MKNGFSRHTPIVYVIRDGVRVIANPNITFSMSTLDAYYRWAKLSPDKSSRAYRTPCKKLEGHEDTNGDFLFVWHHLPATADA